MLPGKAPVFKAYLRRSQVQQFALPRENLFALLAVLEREPHERGAAGDEGGVDVEFLGLLVAQRLEGLVKQFFALADPAANRAGGFGPLFSRQIQRLANRSAQRLEPAGGELGRR